MQTCAELPWDSAGVERREDLSLDPGRPGDALVKAAMPAVKRTRDGEHRRSRDTLEVSRRVKAALIYLAERDAD